MNALEKVEQSQMKKEVPAFRPGDTVRVHVKIRQWRRQRALEKTWRRRPDLLAQVPLSEEDRRWLESLKGMEL